MSSFPWYAIEIRPRKEIAVALAIEAKGLECFLPLYQKRKIWTDRVKVSPAPLFPGYVFCRLDLQNRLPLLVTPGVSGIVATGKVPAPIAEGEIEAIRLALKSGFLLEPCDQLNEGDRVYVINGPMTGYEGTFVRYRGRDRLILTISLIQRSVAVELDRLSVEPVKCRTGWAGSVPESQTVTSALP